MFTKQKQKKNRPLVWSRRPDSVYVYVYVNAQGVVVLYVIDLNVGQTVERGLFFLFIFVSSRRFKSKSARLQAYLSRGNLL